jgi:hypothetical protein
VDEVKDLTKPLADFINAEGRQTFDIRRATRDWTHEMVIVGSSVMFVGWQRRMGWRFRPGQGRKGKPQPVVLHDGPVVEHVPREFMLWRKDRTIEESDVVARQKLMLRSELALAVQMDGWDEEAVEDILRSPGTIDGGGGVVEAKRDAAGVTADSNDLYDIREVWVEWPLAAAMTMGGDVPPLDLQNADDPAIPLVVTLGRTTGAVVRVVAHPYFFGRWPFFDVYFRKVPGQAYSFGTAKLLEHIQRGITSMTNQAIDSVTIANSLKMFTQNPRLTNAEWTPNRPMFVENLNDVLIPNVQKGSVPDIQLVNLLNAVGERVTGISDPLLGRETRMGGHPSPATSTLVQLGESAKLFDFTQREIRLQLNKVGQFLLSLYQQFPTRMEEVIGQEDAARVQEILLTDRTLRLDVHALSEGTNPEAERQNAVLVDQVVTNYYAFVTRLLPLLDQPNAPPTLKAGITSAIESKTKSVIQLLETLQIDDPDEFVMKLGENQGGQADQLQQFMAGILGGGQAGAGQGAVSGAANGGVPGGGDGAAAALAGALGSGFQLGGQS